MIEILSQSAFASVQDLGRFEAFRWGVGTAGAMDRLALVVGNLLLGNPEGAAGIEAQVFPFEIRFGSDVAFALTGADCAATLDGIPLLPWASARARVGQVLRLTVPRLEGHSFQDTQTYKSEALIAAETARDPLPKLRGHLVPALMTSEEWDDALTEAGRQVAEASAEAEARPFAEGAAVMRHVFYEGQVQQVGGCLRGEVIPSTDQPTPQGQRINMVTAIRRVLELEMARNDRMVVFGEDVGPKGGVHGVTLGLQDKFGSDRVFDTSLSEEGIIGRAVAGRLAAGARDPVPQICRTRNRTDQRLWQLALAHKQPLCRADGGADAGRLFQMRRPVPQSDQRGGLCPRPRLEGRNALKCRGCCGAAAGRLARE